MSDPDLSDKRVKSSKDEQQLGSAQAVDSPPVSSLRQREEFLEKKKRTLSQELEKNPRQKGVPNEARDKAILALIATEKTLGGGKEVKGGVPQLSTVAEAVSSSSSFQKAQPEARGERMNLFKVRNSQTLKGNSEKLDLFNEWVRVHSETYADLLPFDEEGVVDLVNRWEVNPERKELVAGAQKAARKSWVAERSEWPVFKALVDGVEAEEGMDAKLERLLANFKAVGATNFRYTMDALNSDKFLRGGGDGDCNTLMHAFKEISEKVLGIDCDVQSSIKEGFPDEFLAPARKTIDGLTGNVAGKDCEYWLFENHFWIQSGGKAYDVLFGELGRPNIGSWLKKQKSDDQNVRVFGEGSAQVKVKLVNKDVVKGRYQKVD